MNRNEGETCASVHLRHVGARPGQRKGLQAVTTTHPMATIVPLAELPEWTMHPRGAHHALTELPLDLRPRRTKDERYAARRVLGCDRRSWDTERTRVPRLGANRRRPRRTGRRSAACQRNDQPPDDEPLKRSRSSVSHAFRKATWGPDVHAVPKPAQDADYNGVVR
jgi:hypothetical protein